VIRIEVSVASEWGGGESDAEDGASFLLLGNGITTSFARGYDSFVSRSPGFDKIKIVHDSRDYRISDPAGSCAKVFFVES
jgi:hypothetical protein